ncbi:MAG: hypothetical protein D6681_22575 [Calditrichaeota bacterium]|nr:MAG: hypothetical protein D6681_22575 [Calditrichota bacterium]
MPAKTQDLDKILSLSESLYEAVMIISKRARQINEEIYQKKRDRQILEELEGGMEEDFLAPEPEEVPVAQEFDEEESPIVYAQEEFLNNKLDYYYETHGQS